MAEKITQKQIFAHIAEVMADDEMVVEFCEKKIAQIEARAAKPRSPRKPKPEVVEFRAKVEEYLMGAEDPVSAADVRDAFEVSVQKASAALRYLVKEGKAEVVESEKASDPKRYAAAGGETLADGESPAEQF
jgi:predicted ArsR family transcriptional regulator